MPTKIRRCSNCGTQFECESWLRAPYSCGEADCEKEAADSERYAHDERREAAERDDYGRY